MAGCPAAVQETVVPVVPGGAAYSQGSIANGGIGGSGYNGGPDGGNGGNGGTGGSATSTATPVFMQPNARGGPGGNGGNGAAGGVGDGGDAGNGVTPRLLPSMTPKAAVPAAREWRGDRQSRRSAGFDGTRPMALTLISLLLGISDGQPIAVAVNPTQTGTTRYVSNWAANSISVVADNNVVRVITGDFDGPQGLAFTPDASRVYVANWNIGQVSVIDTATNTVAATINVGNQPAYLAVDPPGQSPTSPTRETTPCR